MFLSVCLHRVDNVGILVAADLVTTLTVLPPDPAAFFILALWLEVSSSAADLQHRHGSQPCRMIRHLGIDVQLLMHHHKYLVLVMLLAGVAAVVKQ